MRSHIGIVLKKELLDIIRDRRSIITGLLIPILLYPMMFGLMGTVMNSVNREVEENTTVAIQASADVKSFIMGNVLNMSGISLIETDDVYAALEDGDIKVALVFDDGAESLLSSGVQVGLSLVYDENRTASTASMSMVYTAINAYNETAAERHLAELGIVLSELKPLAARVVSLAEIIGEGAGGAGMMLSMLLPMLVTIYLSVGGLSVSTDLFAGEKERHTMEALLCTRAGRNDILVGKFLTVVIYSLVSVATSVSGIVIAYAVFPDLMNMGIDEGISGGFNIPWQAAVFTVAAIAVLAMTFAAVQVIVSCWSRSVKEAGAYSTPIMFVSYVPVFATMMMQSGDFSIKSAFIPVYNTIGCIKMVLAGITDYAYMGTTLGVSAVFLFAVLIVTRMMFKNENIMLRG